MKKLFLCVISLAITVLFISCSAKHTIKRVYFAKQAADHVDLSQANVIMTSDALGFLGTKQPIYKIARKELSEEEKFSIQKVFGMENSHKQLNHSSDFTSYSMSGKTLKFYKNGTFHYTGYADGYESNTLTITDEQAKIKADEFLKNNGWLPDDFKYSGVSDSTSSTSFPNSERRIVNVYAKTIKYSRYINDNTPVLGNSHIYVVVTTNGISEVSLAYNLYIDDGEVTTLSSSEIIEQIKKNESFVQLNSNKVNSDLVAANIKKIELVYIEHAYDKEATHIQPCYRLTGTISDSNNESDEFSTLVRAIPDSLTIE